MNITAKRARCLSLVLLLSALLNHGVFPTHDLGARQPTYGLLRLGRDLMRRNGGFAIDDSPTLDGRRRLSLWAFAASSR
jgi:hypothetical protein